MIRAFVGRLGQGKTYGMVYHALQWMKRHRLPVYTNMRELKFPSSVYVHDIRQIPDLRAGLLLLDEGAVVLSARTYQRNPIEVLTSFRQSRKQALDLFYTSQGFDDTDKTLRELTNEIYICRKLQGPRGAMFVHGVQDATEKEPHGRRLVRLLPDVAALFDTDEIISASGGSAGIGAAAELLQRGRAHASRPPLQPPSWERKVKACRHYDFTASLSDAGRDAAAFLEHAGRLDRNCTGWLERVQVELQRRRWLALFGLTAENVPWYTCPSNPWVLGQCPTLVKHRIEQEDAQATLQLIQEEATRKVLQAAARSSAKEKLFG